MPRKNRKSSYTPGYTQRRLLDQINAVGYFNAVTPQEQVSCRSLHDHGLIDRDPGDSNRYVKKVKAIPRFDEPRP